jgi:HYR domain/Secretion system C-terminal sorting domain
MFKCYTLRLSKWLLLTLLILTSFLSNAQNTCTAYTVGNVNNFCGCTDVLFAPYGLYVETSNGCVEYFKADSVTFTVSSDSSAYLKGIFRNFTDWRPVLVDLKFAKTRTKTPRMELCNRDSPLSIADAWRYFSSMSGTMKFDTDPILTVSSRNGSFQLGIGATGQNAASFGAAGQFALSNGKVGGFGFTLSSPQPVACPAPINPCLTDAEAPVFTNCPTNISITSSGTSAVATWTPPTVTDNCSTPSLSSTHTSGQSFPMGTTTVVYTAQDSLRNRSECRFSVTVVQVTPPTGCVKYSVENTNNYCGCSASQFLPYGIYLNAPNACGVEYYKADTVFFTINNDSTATLKGTFRSFSTAYTPLVVDIFFQKTTQRVPKFELCNRDSAASVAATWRYFGNMSGTFKLGTDAPISMTSRNGLFQVGTSANGQNAGVFGASGQFSLSTGQQGGFGFSLSNPQNVSCLPPPNMCLTDVTPPTLNNCPADISVTSESTTAIVTWTPPTATDNCTTPSVTSNFPSGQIFAVGTTTVIYTAKDSLNNKSECRFNVIVKQVIPLTGCVRYNVDNTNNNCGCAQQQFLPYGIYLQSLNACGSEFFKADSVRFTINADSSATLKGVFRSFSTAYTPLVVDIIFPKTTEKLPKFELCNRDSSAALAATWRYFGSMSGTFKLGTDATTFITGRNGLFQFGTSANGQNAGVLGASGQFKLSNGQQGGFNFSVSNPQSVPCIPLTNFCFNDMTPPVLSPCPANIALISPTTTAIATWTPPTATDNCSTPTLSSTHTSGQSFGLGSTIVTYTARDSANNTAECRFMVSVKQVLPPTGCIKYTVENTNNICGCSQSQYQPYGIYLQSTNACGSEFYKVDSLVFQTNSDSTATLKGTFRSNDWTPLVIDIYFYKTNEKTPKLTGCNRDSMASLAVNWRYFGNMIGTIKVGNGAPLGVGSRNGLFQMGVAANGQNSNLLGASGDFIMSNGQRGGLGFVLVNPQNALCVPTPNFCLMDMIPPTFNNCPNDISVTTATTSAVVNWATITASDNCTRATITSNFTSGQTFPVGTTNVIYTAKDSLKNTAECRFAVTVKFILPPTGCLKYTVNSTNNNCGCAGLQFKPYGIYLESTNNGCGLDYYKADSVTFQINADSTASLKGTFRNESWQPLYVDIFFKKTALRQPKLENCNRDSAIAIAAAWRYFGDMAGTIRLENQQPMFVASRNGLFQVGNSANGQNAGVFGASGQFLMSNGQKGGFGFTLTNPQNALCSTEPDYCVNDVVPPSFSNCPANIAIATRQSSAVATWTPPTAMDNCSAIQLSSNYQSGAIFSAGTTYVVYSAVDAANNRSECRFSVAVTQTVGLNCTRYNVGNTQNLCGCAATKFAPYSFYIENPTPNGCNLVYFKSDDAAFQINEDSTATLRGTFRSASWQPIFVNVTFAKTTARVPRIDGCNNDSSAAIAANWRYFGAMRGLMQFDTSGLSIFNVTNGTSLMQFGVGANGQDGNILGANGLFTMSNGQKGGFAFTLGTAQPVACNTEPNPCANDVTKPVFNACPSTVNVGTLQATAIANWTTPSAYDNCTTPSVSSNFTSGQSFPVGVTTVTYKATDAAGNSSTCNFAVNVFRLSPQTGCNRYNVDNTSNICGCTSGLYAPYSFYLDSPSSTCGVEYFKSDTAYFVTNSDSTGTLRGRFRSPTWQSVMVDITFAKTALRTPIYENCNRDSVAISPVDWKYLGAMSGTIQFDSTTPIRINSRNGGFQFGSGASGQNPGLLSASGQFSLANGKKGGFSFLMTNPTPVACPLGPCSRDTLAPVFNNCPTNINVATSQTSTIINWATPTARDNCTNPPLVLSNFQPGQSLPIGATTIIYLARDTAGNQAECRFVVTVTQITATQDLTNTAFEILRFAPNPAYDALTVDVSSPLEGDVVFNLSNVLGQVLEQRKQTLKVGENQLRFDVSRLAKGVYWLKPAAINGRKAMVKFIKM